MPVPSDLAIQSVAPAQYGMAAAVTLSDSTVIPVTSALWVSHTTTLAISVVMANGDTVVFDAHAAASAGVNVLLPIRVTRVRSTGSTAGIKVVALY